MNESQLLLVEDDPEISESLADYLRGKGFRVQVAGSAEAGHELLARGGFDLVLLDVMLPGEDGLSFCRRVRASGGPPIIMLTALSEPTDKVVGLELGADDYVSKPFDLRELLARIRVVLRRGQTNEAAARAPASEIVMTFSGFTFYPYRRFLRSPAGLRVPLTGAETDLLLVLCQHPRQVLSREELIRLTRGKNFPIATRSVDLLVSRLRRKLAGDDPLDDPIRTVRADGYAFQPEVTAQ
ncbi:MULTISPECIES: response regulator transcription factor [Caballeronia]|uniref:Transcriptional regulator n=1 Tax=Caballeronia zhejiangensis TaxID=871203 RepID=A0A656QRN3_9BURK|nr:MULTISPECIES: response regulator transcription factor [Caballeronia]EKS71264.1 two component transcriptional regulator, winged helix family protein [Burkholderia sp. SJ98]KDR32114.1 transcriptional regulator [Caballeronia zhejiangensis]MCG7403975.1 response regulator transcription factor [Caballeronia zhejiangensis]MCI1045456.1 response regulator transcription factor [Caballeronia zhejiangensis]MDR5766620.1 response regulator transcription factor [Caballeronia sp. LZ028]